MYDQFHHHRNNKDMEYINQVIVEKIIKILHFLGLLKL